MIRLFFLTFFLYASTLFATQEIQRIDSIVSDIEKLRHNYESQLRELQNKNIILENKNSRYKKKIADLKKQIKSLQKQQAKEAKREKPKVIIKEKIKKVVIISKPLLCEDENKFPKLKLKNNYVTPKIKNQEVKRVHFQAAAFRLREDADIYAGVNSLEVVERWEKGTSFTSNVKTATRIKITGYFVEKVWRKADKELWVKCSNAKKR